MRQLLIAIPISVAACASHPASEATRPRQPSTSAPAHSTLDSRVQAIVRSELDRAVREWQPEATFAIVVDPASGSVLAMEGRSQRSIDDPMLASRQAWVTGSTLKAFTLGAALEEKTIAPDARVDCRNRAYGEKMLVDAGQHEMLTVAEVLATSSNVGTTRVFDTLGLPRLDHWLRKFHFGEQPGVIPEVTDGTSIRAAALAIGELATATPLQVVAGYAAIFNGGQYLAPTFTTASPPRGERVLRPETAQTLVSMLEGAVAGPLGTGKQAAVVGLRVAGKTGTGDLDPNDRDAGRWYASFVGSVLDREPRFVGLVGLVAPRAGGSGASAAAPVFARIAKRLVAERTDNPTR